MMLCEHIQCIECVHVTVDNYTNNYDNNDNTFVTVFIGGCAVAYAFNIILFQSLHVCKHLPSL